MSDELGYPKDALGEIVARIASRGTSTISMLTSRFPGEEVEALAKAASPLILAARAFGPQIASSMSPDSRKRVEEVLTGLDRTLDQADKAPHLDYLRDSLTRAERELANVAHFAILSRLVQGWPEYDAARKGIEAAIGMQDRMSETMQRHESQLRYATAKAAEFQALLDSGRDKLAMASLDDQSAYFDTDAKNHAKSAGRWLIAAGCFAALLAGLVVAAVAHWGPFADLEPHPDPAKVVLATLARVLTFGVASTFLLVTLRQYGAHRHNAVVNQHRAHALLTYRAIRAGTNDEKARAIILTQAATCIFAPQPTAFARGPGAEASNLASGTLAAVAAAATGKA